MKIAKMFLAAMAAMLCGAESRAAIVFSDDFNANSPGLGIVSLLPANKWTVVNNVDVLNTASSAGFGFTAGFPATMSGSVVDLAGSGLTDNRGKITTVQSFGDVSGSSQAYRVSFRLAGANRPGGVVDTVRVSLGGWFSDVVVSPATGFSTVTLQAASGASGALSFALVTSGNPSRTVGALLDDVALSTEVIPEPASMLIFGLGAMGLGVVRLRRRK